MSRKNPNIASRVIAEAHANLEALFAGSKIVSIGWHQGYNGDPVICINVVGPDFTFAVFEDEKKKSKNYVHVLTTECWDNMNSDYFKSSCDRDCKVETNAGDITASGVLNLVVDAMTKKMNNLLKSAQECSENLGDWGFHPEKIENDELVAYNENEADIMSFVIEEIKGLMC